LKTNNYIRIMVVDDHFIVRIGLAATINVEPDMLVVAEAGDGLQSIAKFREHTPDITLMDLRLPGMSGVEAIEAIRRDFAQARIIVLSTYDGDEAIARALRAGAQAYLLKTALHDELLNAIRAVHAGKKHIPTEIAARLAQRLPDSELSSREIEVLKLIAKGMSNKEVAGVLFITEGTVKFHVLNILNKLNANDRTMAVTIALQRGIIFL
jgi:two-component system NarL family response regulator